MYRIVALLVGVLGSAVVGAATPDESSLRVGVREAPPFSMRAADGQWTGISVELWREAADSLGLDYQFVPQPTLPAMFNALEAGDLDASVGALTVTQAREERIDFTHPFYNSGLAIATRREAGGWWQALKAIVSPAFLSALAALGAILLAFGAAMWLLERRQNSEQFPPDPAHGIGDGFWWSAVTMTTVGYGDKAPVTFGGRVLAVVWMFVGIITISGFTASITSSLTTAQLSGRVNGPQDLLRVAVMTIDGSTGEQYLADRGIRHSSGRDVAAALAALRDGRVDAVVYDEPILRYAMREQGADRLMVLPQRLGEEPYGIALEAGSTLREPLNRELLAIRNGDGWSALVARYLGPVTP